MADMHRRLLDKCGKKGVKCPCCNPCRKRNMNKDRAIMTRKVRAEIKVNTLKEIKNENDSIQPE